MSGADQALLDVAHRLVELARRAGAEEADVLALAGTTISVAVQDGHADKIERSESTDIGLRVIIGKREAVVSGSRFDAESLERLANRAVDMARAAPPDETAGLADPRLLARDLPDLDLCDETPVEADALIEAARRGEAAGLEVAGVTRSSGASASASRRDVALVASNGFAGGYRRTSHGISVSMVAGEGTAMERDYDYSSATHAGDIAPPETIGRTAGERAVRRLEPRKVATCRVPVVYEQRIAGGLVGHLAAAVNGTAIARGTSFLKDRLGTAVFPSGLRIVDDPLRRRGLASRPFDAEGAATALRAVVEDGVLATWLLDCRTARKLGLATTGHAARGTSSSPSPSASNIHLMPGAHTPADLIGSVARGFFVTELIGMGVNGVTGDYSRGAAGFWIENGEIAYPVSEVTIASNLIDMYARLAAADDLVFRASVNAPTVLIEEMTVAGR
jgi:PmbA protein